MPELPEVEIIKRGLEQKVIGRTIAKIDVRAKKLFQGDPASVIGSKIISLERKAKMIVVNLDNDYSLLIHLKMTGQLVFDEKDCDLKTRVAGGHPSKDLRACLPNQFTHVIFKFKDGSILYFNDLRKFGYIKLYKTKEIPKLKVLIELGPDPFKKELSAEYLMSKIVRRPKIKIKQLIMDQTMIAGIGNIYADESLFCARISPLRLAKNVKRTELIKWINCARKVLELSIKHGGSSENTYVDIEGKKGQMQNFFKVYRQTGLPCPVCGGKITRTVVGGRGTHYCPACQH